MKTIDTHAHLDQVENVEQSLEEAHKAGVEHVVAVGVDLKSNQRNLELKNKIKNPTIHVALGIHPGNINPAEVDETLSFIRSNIQEAVAVGEIGLDYWYKWVKKDEIKKQEQRDIFSRQLEIAKEFSLPIVIHSRGSWRDCLDMAQKANIKKAVFHWFSGPLDILDEILNAGYFISASPAVAASPQPQEAVKHAPIERILIETDCPVFFGSDENGFRSTPKDVARTLKSCSQLKNIDEEKAAAIFYKNSKEFFGI